MSLIGNTHKKRRNDSTSIAGAILKQRKSSTADADIHQLRQTYSSNDSYVDSNTDEEQVYSVLETNGKLLDGISAMEVWILREEDSTLVQAPGGFWRSIDFVPKDQKSLERIEDKRRPDYVSPFPVLLGTGLVGVVWNEYEPIHKNVGSTFAFILGKQEISTEKTQTSSYQKSTLTKSFQSMTNLHSDFSHTSGSRLMTRTFMDEKFDKNTLRWRHIKSIILDPCQPTFERVSLMEKSGLSQCAGVKFNVSGIQGILLLFACIDHAQLCSQDNNDIHFLRAIANHVGSTIALSSHRSHLRIDKIKGSSFPDVVQHDTGGYRESFYRYFRKLKGGILEPPPPMPLNEGLLTFIGVFLTLFALQGASDWIEQTTGYGIIMGPFGALMTLQYGLTMAPVSQPRNVLFGQVVATIIALIFSSISKDWVNRNLRISLSTATAITAKVLLGIAHPPAGATALIVSSGEFNWKILISVVLSNFVAIVLSIMINNLSQKRQYPTYLNMGEGLILNLLPIRGFDHNDPACRQRSGGDGNCEISSSRDFKPSPKMVNSSDGENDRSDFNCYDDDSYQDVRQEEDEVLTNEMYPSSDNSLDLDIITPSVNYNYGSMVISPLLFSGRNYKVKCENNRPNSDCSSDLEDFPLQTEIIPIV
mmetsp:Transcript_6698/g.12602  ORF Transcript_6698/g.12602 Transcript_6698/m.12602 type:complete len:647 (+) Transcript_6698:161-2101(+)|eukprot:CAMPEP_0176484180 /NCGR_PEP_ID=MMETSP0200_2-20121128/4317_1 /TAXON_ID=947934 /ORGANISM="Chaetoceros sp., Strain GSL56" /LENGTH=646 /DNA_ID=CAMNT_0017880637 /DNA_START=75 /DNA_END=2015 /DNA_ORIENTATION=-